MSGRPAGDPMLWGTDETWADGPHAGELTKERPSDDVIARGVQPDTKIPASWFNYTMNDVTRRAAYLDLFDVLNFDAPDDALALTSGVKTSTAMIWHPYARAYVVVQDDSGDMVVSYSPDAKAWTEVTIPGSPAEGCSLAMSAYTGTIFAPEQTTGTVHRLDSPSLAYISSSTLLPNTIVRGCKPGPTEAIAILVYGRDSVTDRPKLWAVTESGGLSATEMILAQTDIVDDDIIDVAWSPTRLVALSNAGRIYVRIAPNPGDDLWFGYVSGGASPDPSGGTVLTNSPQGISYDEVNGIFWMASNQGEIWTSLDGTSWTPAPTIEGVEISGSIFTHNGVWFLRGAFTAGHGGDRLFHSTDRAATWRDSPLPLTWASVCSEAGRRLVMIDGDGKTSRSRRVRG